MYMGDIFNENVQYHNLMMARIAGPKHVVVVDVDIITYVI